MYKWIWINEYQAEWTSPDNWTTDPHVRWADGNMWIRGLFEKIYGWHSFDLPMNWELA